MSTRDRILVVLLHAILAIGHLWSAKKSCV
jgi:hypothetical protein